ncbi:LOB domain-containing protein 24-like [Tripterygium wilfordii]|uniref:LOB domain-containing protein 24-like n=1 Tax=Tripterygium wilfordii TaxID=458696 RepID=UPI0018F82D01|nr:LOB domain-containing protein 24-like [Tripterygium wilfordii]
MGRCAACKYLRRRCPSDCIFSPYFPSNDPQRFAILHKIYGASNVGKMLQGVQYPRLGVRINQSRYFLTKSWFHQLPSRYLRAEAVDSMYSEAQYRIEDPVYGCVGMISALHQQLHIAESELAKTRAEIALFSNNNTQEKFNHKNLSLEEQTNVG